MKIGLGIGLGYSKESGGGAIPPVNTVAPVIENYNLALPVLDQLSTPSGAAYSLRKLRVAYSGSAIRVRRSSDNTESDIGFDGNNDLNVTALTTFVGSGDGFVTTWYDQSGNGRHAAQPNPSAQPRIVQAGVLNQSNARPVIKTNGSQSLNSGASSILRNVPGATIGIIGKYPSGAANSNSSLVFVSLGSALTSTRLALNMNPSIGTANNLSVAGRRLDADAFAVASSTTSRASVANQLIVETGVARYSDGRADHFTNGTQDLTNAPFQSAGNTSDTNSLRISLFNDGALSAPANSELSEVFIFDAALSTERQTLERNQGAYFGIPVPAPNVVGQTLSSTTGTWTGTAPITYSYQWKRGATNIGTNSSTYTLVQADAGNTSNITCVVTATNAGGSANATSNQIAQILTVRTNSFLTASAISDATIRGGLNTFDIGMIANSLDTKMKALYPFVSDGADSNARALQHRWNFMDARDLNAAFRLQFTGGWIHSSNGALPNGLNTFANTFLSPATVINDNNDGHLSYYSRTNNSGISAVDIGCGTASASFNMVIKFGTNLSGACINMSDSNLFTNAQSSDRLYVASQNNVDNIRNLYRDGVNLQTQTVAENAAPPSSFTVFIGARNGITAGSPTFVTNRQCAFASVGNGLSASEVTAFNTLVNNFQTTLSRNV